MKMPMISRNTKITSKPEIGPTLTASSRKATLSGRPSYAKIQAASCDVAAMKRIVPDKRAVDTNISGNSDQGMVR